MSISHSWILILITAISYMIFLGIDIFGIDNLYYYKTIAYGLAGVFLLVTFYLLIA